MSIVNSDDRRLEAVRLALQIEIASHKTTTAKRTLIAAREIERFLNGTEQPPT